MKFLITYIAAIIACGLIEELPAQQKGHAIKNISGGSMPIPRKQLIGKKFMYTAKAKKGFCYVYKDNNLFYCTEKLANKYKLRKFYLSKDLIDYAKKKGFKKAKGI